MSRILNIDTSMEAASVSIAADGIVEAFILNTIQKEHASFLHNAVKELLGRLSLDIKQLDAIAVTNGPGSYTGLRVGMASAKGLCYALQKPFITIGTLNALAATAISISKETTAAGLFCPMIDARRMEVYTAVFDHNMTELLPACAMILDENSFAKMLQKDPILFFGSGAVKWSKMIDVSNADFIYDLDITKAVSRLAYARFKDEDFTDLSYSEPLYVKDFFSP